MLLLLLTIALGVVLLLVTTLASERLGWLWTALVCLVILALPVLVLQPRRPRRWFAAVVVLSLLLGLGGWAVAPPSHDRIHAAYDADVDAPEGFVEQGRDERGNTWCFKGCPEVTVSYAPPGGMSSRDARQRFGDALVDQGWSPYRHDGSSGSGYVRGRWRISLTEPLGDESSVRVHVTR